MKNVLLAFLLLFFTILPSCGKKTITEEFVLVQAADPTENIGRDTQAEISYKDSEGRVFTKLIYLKDLTIKQNGNPNSITLFQVITYSENINWFYKYCIVVNSEEELTAWQQWKKKWTTVKSQIVYPPGYVPANIKPEKE